MPRIPADRRMFYRAHVLTPIGIHLHSLEMLEQYGAALTAYGQGDKAQAVVHAEQALCAVDELFDALHRAETGKWPAWYFGERFVGLEASRDRLRVALAALRGDPVPPVRANSGYPELYQYQEPFLKNFPLLYPHGTIP